jgi:1-acyl-sn-glycerol-3-phosphate acyltransferase
VGSIPFDRENMVNSRDNLKYIRKLLDTGHGLAIAPEGMRHKHFFETRELLPFKQGFIKFLFSAQTQYLKKNRPLIRFYPMIINYLPNASFRSRLLIKVGKSIPCHEYIYLMNSKRKDEACELFSIRLRAAMERLIIHPSEKQ